MSADWHQLSSVTAMDVYKSTPDLTKSQELQRLGHRWRKVSFLYRFFVFTIFAEKIIGDDLDKEKWQLIVCSTSKHDLKRVLAWAEYGLMNWLSEIYRAIQGLQFVMKLVLQVLAHENGWQLFIQREFLVLLPPQWIRLAVGCTHQNGSRQEQLSQKRMEWTPPQIGSWILCPGDQSGRELDPLSQRLEWPRDGMVYKADLPKRVHKSESRLQLEA
ncbi:hypothetical protein SELMODRAFT_432515 [Selaginella moellendorffii]|uniref:Uncharacterized protein n=1 Tax=Selaginella moellendorffii TaxID=88036 RepID=D8TG88_SELML|nr:hypothetical protein SELMODRAFT_432515 [Selaginella moellendorffii]